MWVTTDAHMHTLLAIAFLASTGLNELVICWAACPGNDNKYQFILC